MNGHESVIRTFSSFEEAKEIKILFLEEAIQSKIIDNSSSMGASFIGETYNHKIELVIADKDFNKAEIVLSKRAELILDSIEKNYYLFSFSNEELYDILLKPDEWSEFDYLLTKRILKESGKNIDEELISSLRKQRIIDLSKPEESQRTWVILGYVLSLLGGLLGLMIGYFMWTSKKTLPNGQKVYSYSKQDRKHGRYIFYIGLLIFPTLLLIRVFMNISRYTY